MGENLADNGGISRAIDAWRADVKSLGGSDRNRMLPGFDGFRKEQMLFLGFAQVWCGDMRPSVAVKRVRFDSLFSCYCLRRVKGRKTEKDAI